MGRKVARDGGRNWIRTSEGVSQQIYSLPPLATWVSYQPACQQASGERRANRVSAIIVCEGVWHATENRRRILPFRLVPASSEEAGSAGRQPTKARIMHGTKTGASPFGGDFARNTKPDRAQARSAPAPGEAWKDEPCFQLAETTRRSGGGARRLRQKKEPGCAIAPGLNGRGSLRPADTPSRCRRRRR